MTVAVLLTADWPETELAVQQAVRLADQLARAGAADVRVLARPAVAAALRAAGRTTIDSADVAGDLRMLGHIAGEAGEPVLLCAGDLVAHGSLLWTLATEPAGRSCALVGPTGPVGSGIVEQRGRIVAVAGRPPQRAPNGFFLGALCVAPGDLPALAAAAHRAAGGRGTADLPTTGSPKPGSPATGDAVALLVPELLADVTPVAVRVRLLRARRVPRAAEVAVALAAVREVDEDAARLRLAVKERDDFFTTYLVSSWSPVVTRLAARVGLTPTGVTWLSVLVALVAAVLFWQASRPAMVAGAVLLYLGFVLDCVDGQLARYTRRFGAFGGWLDTMADRGKEFVVYAGLAAGADRVGLAGAWQLAIAAMVLQTVRHMTDTWYGALHDMAATRPADSSGGGLGDRLSRASNRVQAEPATPAYWLKRIVVLPIGERWALLAVVAGAVDGRAALAVLLAWAVLAAAYTLLLRSVRSWSMRVPVLAAADVSRHRDDGPLTRRVLGRAGAGRLPPLPLAGLAVAAAAALLAVVAGAPSGDRLPAGAGLVLVTSVLVLGAGLGARATHRGPLDWLVPAALRAAEYLFVAAVAAWSAVPEPILFVVLFTLALWHYDLTARMEKAAPAGGDRRWNPGWDGRVALVTGAALFGVTAAGMAVVASYVGLMFGIGAIVTWSASPSMSTPLPEGGSAR